MPKHITFNQLKAVMSSRADRPGMPSRSSLANAATALGKFCRVLEADMDSRVGDTLRDGLNPSLELYREQLAKAGNARETINNQVSLMNHWAKLVRALDHEGANAAGAITPFQEKVNGLFATRSDMRRICKKARVPYDTVRAWRRGSIPRSTSDDALRRLAIAGGLTEDALIRLLPFAVSRTVACDACVTDIPSRRRGVELARSPYLLKPQQATEDFKREWRALLMHKVPLSSSMRNEQSAGKFGIRDKIRAAVQAKPDDEKRVWRVRPIEDYRTPETPAWVNVIGLEIVPTAEKVFKEVTSFLGWLRLPREQDGHAIPSEKLSMGMLVDEVNIDQFLEWHADRVGSVNNAATAFIATVRSLTRAETGYLWLATEIGRKRGFDEASWRTLCERVNGWLETRYAQYMSIREQARDPALPLKPLLDMPRPLQGFKDGISRYAQEFRRSADQRAAQARDLALLSLSVSNPLRLTNLRLLTYKQDNTGHLRKATNSTGWEVFVPRGEFKNIRGAARSKDYRMPVSEMAAYYLEEYVSTWWNHLGGPGQRGLLFIAKGKPDQIWDDLDTQYARVTKKILGPIGCPGIRTHATRYLVGTSIIMATQGNADLAAAALHDMKTTVERHYKKLLDGYAARGVQAVIGKDLSFDDDGPGMVTIASPEDFIKRLPI